LESLLKSPKRLRGVAADELLKVKEAYGDRRRTQIVNLKKGASSSKMLTTTDLLPDQSVWIGVTVDGQVARTHEDKEPKHSGNDAPRWLVKAATTDTIYFVSKSGKAAAVAVHVIPESEKLTDGPMFFKVSPLTENDTLAAVFALPTKRSENPPETCLITATRFGMLKKSLISELPGPSSQTFTLVKVNEGDRLGWVVLSGGKKKDILLVTALGMAIRFSDEDVRPMGLMAAGVNGIKLDDKDELVGMEILPSDGEIFLLASDGKAKRIEQKEFPTQGRYGKGVKAWDLPNKVKLAGIVIEKATHMATIHLSKGAPKSTRLDAAGIRKRAATKGDVVVEVKPGEEVTSVNVGWMVDKFVKAIKAEPEKPSVKRSIRKEKKPATKKVSPGKGKKAAAKKQVAKRSGAKSKKK
jgi:DNA gyrase subunit A